MPIFTNYKVYNIMNKFVDFMSTFSIKKKEEKVVEEAVNAEVVEESKVGEVPTLVKSNTPIVVCVDGDAWKTMTASKAKMTMTSLAKEGVNASAKLAFPDMQSSSNEGIPESDLVSISLPISVGNPSPDELGDAVDAGPKAEHATKLVNEGKNDADSDDYVKSKKTEKSKDQGNPDPKEIDAATKVKPDGKKPIKEEYNEQTARTQRLADAFASGVQPNADDALFVDPTIRGADMQAIGAEVSKEAGGVEAEGKK